MSVSSVILESQVDWLTAVATDKRNAQRLWESGTTLIEFQKQASEPARVFNVYGYTGEHCGSVSWGRNGERVLVQLSGPTANAYYRAVVPFANHFTRLDVQVTFRADPPTPELARHLYLSRGVITGRGHGNVNLRYWESSTGGQTVYVGSPGATQMGRLYDKGAESGRPEYAACWRAEVQFRDTMADACMEKLMGKEGGPGMLASIVIAWFQHRGVEIPLSADTPLALEVPPRPETTPARRLAWLRRTVRPTVDYLIQNRWTVETLEALGLTTVIDVTSLPEWFQQVENIRRNANEGASDVTED